MCQPILGRDNAQVPSSVMRYLGMDGRRIFAYL